MKSALLILVILFCHAIALATPPMKKDPEHSFEKFWRIFDKYYAHFQTRQVDWQHQYETFRPQVDPNTTDEELLDILNQMVAPLKDGHVVISPTGDLPASSKYAPFYQEFPTKELQARFHQVTLDNLQKQGFGPWTRFNSERYQIGGYCRSKDLGYLQLNGFGGMPLEAFARQLDEMVIAFADVKGLIIDIRINGGGSPAYLGALVGRLTQVRRLVGYGRRRISKPRHEFTSWTAYHISPQSDRQLVKPTVLLTSGSTISAGDHCVLYLKELPYVRQIGESTNGIFSPMLGRKLPNGWEISLSDGQTVSAKRTSYEGRGVPVDIEVVHRRSDMVRGNDVGLSKALAFLRVNRETLAEETICYEQLAVNFYADSLLPNKVYGSEAVYSTGLVEEDATLLAPFSKKCLSLQSVDNPDGIQKRIEAEQTADSSFYNQNVKSRIFVTLREPINARRGWHWPFAKRDARRLTIAHHITLGGRNYVRLHLGRGGWKGETILVVLNREGRVVEHCALWYDYLSAQFYK